MPLPQRIPFAHRVGELSVSATPQSPASPATPVTPGSPGSPATPITLARDLSTTQALDVIVRACGQQVLDQVEPLLAHRDAKALHDMRVGIRRLRVALSLLRRPLGDGEKLAWVSTETRDLAAPLGHASDLDVAVRDHAERLTGSPRRKLLDLREGAYDEALAVVSSDRWLDLSTHLDRFLRRLHDEVPVDPPITEAAVEALDRTFRRVTERGASLERANTTQRHQVRIEAKKLRYGALFFSSLYAVPPGAAPESRSAAVEFASSVAQLQDALGELRDVQMTRHILELVGVTPPDVDSGPFLERAIAAHADVVARGPFWHPPAP